MLNEVILPAVVAGLLASLACGLGVLPLAFGADRLKQQSGVVYAFAGGLMFSASVYNLIAPSLTIHTPDQSVATGVNSLSQVLPVLVGILLGAGFLHVAEHRFSHLPGDSDALSAWGGRTGLLIFLAMTIHSIPEGVAVGVGYAADAVGSASAGHLGPHLALAIGIHNIPEGLAVALPMRAAGASISRCFAAAVVTSLPQPIAAIPASYLSWFFQPIMPYLMGFAAGAMIFLILLELIPDALSHDKPIRIAWGFMIGFCLMLLVQVML